MSAVKNGARLFGASPTKKPALGRFFLGALLTDHLSLMWNENAGLRVGGADVGCQHLHLRIGLPQDVAIRLHLASRHHADTSPDLDGL